MSKVFVEEGGGHTPSKKEYELRRLPAARAASLCYAPFVALSRDEAGLWAPCRYTQLRLPEIDALAAWNGDTMASIRGEFRSYEIDEGKCAECVDWWRAGWAERSPALDVFDPMASTEAGPAVSPRLLHLDLGAALDDLSLSAVLDWVPKLRRLELESGGPLNDAAHTILGRVATLAEDDRPEVVLSLSGGGLDSQEISEGVSRIRARVFAHEIASEPGLQRVTGLGRRAHAAGAAFDLVVVISRDNWFHLHRSLNLAIEIGALLDPVPEKLPAASSLRTLGAKEIETIHDFAWRWGSQCGFEHLPEAAQKPWRQFLDTLRRWQAEAGGRSSSEGTLVLPEASDPMVEDEDQLLRFLDGLMRIYAHPEVERFLRSILERPDFQRRASRRVSLRLAALWLGSTFGDPELDQVLRRIYRHPSLAKPLIAADKRAVSGLHLEPALETWLESYRLGVADRSQVFGAAGRAEAAEVAEHGAITVIVPAFRHASFVANAIESALGQTRAPQRVLVVDDASDDATAEIAAALPDPRVVVRRNERNLGLGPSLARALGAVETPFVAVLNSDDLLHPDRLRRCLAELETRPDAALVATEVEPIDSGGRRCGYAQSSPIFDGRPMFDWLRWHDQATTAGSERIDDPFFTLLAGNWLLTSSNLTGRTEFFRQTMKRWAELEFTVDWQLFLDAALDCGLVVLREPLLGYRLHASNTVWFDEERAWRYYLEVCQVAARALASRLEREDLPERRLSLLSAALSGPLARNNALDGSGLILGDLMNRLGMTALDLAGSGTRDSIRRLLESREAQDRASSLAGELGGGLESLRRAEEIRAELSSALGRAAALDLELRGERAAASRGPTDPGEIGRLLLETQRERDELAASVSLASAGFGHLLTEWNASVEREDEMQGELRAQARELASLRESLQYRLGQILVGRLRLGDLARQSWSLWSRFRQWLGVFRLTLERRWPRRRPRRAMATIVWNFPIYSQTFVYQELTQLQQRGFELRHAYSIESPGEHLARRFRHLGSRKRKLWLEPSLHRRDFERYRSSMPEKVDRLVGLLSEASFLSPRDIRSHSDFLQAFTFTRMVEAWAPHYLHSYFFYDRSLHALVAGFLLDLPRGISCYADHLLDDYELKVVSLHLKQCQIVIATSRRIKEELLSLAPDLDLSKVLVKANAVDCDSFPVIERSDPGPGEPFRIACVSRLEPKKGLLFLVEAVRILRHVRKLPVELHLVGAVDHGVRASERYKARLDEALDGGGLRGVVHLEGRCSQEEVRRFLEISHVFAAPFVELDSGDKDGIPTSLLEAMSSGLPPVVTDAGSIGEVIEPGRDGLMVPQRDPEALAAALESLLLDPRRRAGLGRSAAAKVRSTFDLRVCEARFHDAVDSVLERASGARPDSP